MNAKINTLYYYCNDVRPMREFYIAQLGLTETFYRHDDEAGWLTLQIGDVNVVYVRANDPVPVANAFASQAGYAGGTQQQHSWVLELPIAAFDAAVERLQAAGTPSLNDEPHSLQPGSKQYIVRDPMGFTIELYTAN
jgi:catechol 2,3-dioxygenase-like lactoylglutathione lyase family enzyme